MHTEGPAQAQPSALTPRNPTCPGRLMNYTRGIYKGSLENTAAGCGGRRCWGRADGGATGRLRGFGGPLQQVMLGTRLWEGGLGAAGHKVWCLHVWTLLPPQLVQSCPGSRDQPQAGRQQEVVLNQESCWWCWWAGEGQPRCTSLCQWSHPVLGEDWLRKLHNGAGGAGGMLLS